jgi:TolA-binding protein
MSKTKGIVVAFFIIAVLVVLSVGGAYLVTAARQKKAMKELQNAKDLLANQKTEVAFKLLKEHIVRYPKGPTTAEALFLLGKIQIDQKPDSPDAIALFERILNDFPNSSYSGQAMYYKTLSLLNERPFKEETITLFEQLTKNPERNKQAASVAELGLAIDELDSRNLSQAKSRMDALLERTIPNELRSRIEDALGELNLRMLFSQELYGDDQTHELKTGEYLYNLARKYHVTLELLMKVNNITDPKRMQTGQKLKVPKVSFSIVVDKYSNTLTLLNDGKFFKKYRVRIGAYENQTPVGEYKVQNKKINPTWVNPRTLKMYKGGDPENELGNRWLSFKDDRLGLHGTIKPETIGYYSSYGCIGMYKADVEELYDLITVGTPLKIVGQMNPKIVEKSRALGFRD